ncbi:hypothetical protein [Xanthomonas nasturtii]|uniref:hypothetical protein n=1 Tax=Xanthomonas nasturtii TaxID=1843581 RepID=UPI00128FDDD5|nr:hypothetical protein [Xanthomonas nasturtii]MCL1498718.1 hypothetical protein [Xanthomonas nasturtii]MCL1522599.1 hypothetical protein [Xanthomonas nasturtii]MCL1534308.1 hypothetical protein [Xanthomonas nasturtii]MCL1542775.1 hypothetical protein [Xanthomonas nasturtii]WVL58017.1 hypothetical protein M3O54_007145 [Xanthomonas nasturtii]
MTPASMAANKTNALLTDGRASDRYGHIQLDHSGVRSPCRRVAVHISLASARYALLATLNTLQLDDPKILGRPNEKRPAAHPSATPGDSTSLSASSHPPDILSS